MSEPLQDEAEVLDGLPVLPDEPPVVVPVSSSRALALALTSPAQAAAAAVGGFVAGAAVVGLAHRRHAKRQAAVTGRSTRRLMSAKTVAGRPPRPTSPKRRSDKAVGELVQIVASRSLLVDVHLLGSPGSDR